MSYGPARSVEAHDTDAGGHFALWLFAVIGALTIGAGLLLSFVPDNGQISLLVTEIDVADIPELLGPGLVLIGGVVLAGTMFAGAWRDYQFDENRLLVLVQGAIGIVGSLAVILGVFGLLDRMDLYTIPGLPF